MKTARLLIVAVGLSVFTVGITFAEPPASQPSAQAPNENHPPSGHSANAVEGSRPHGTGDQTSEQGDQASGTEVQTDGKYSQANADSRTPEKGGQAGPVKAPPKHQVNNPSLPRPALNKTPSVAKSEMPVNKPANNNTPVTRPSVGGETAVLVPAVARKLAGPTTSIGGVAPSNIKTSTAGINGTGMQRTTPR